MEEESRMQLEIWPGDWGLPSVDHQCLSTMAYCKFAGAPVETKVSNNPWKSPSGEFPVLRRGDDILTKVTEIFECLRRQNYGSDQGLSVKQMADTVAFAALLEDKLHPAMLHLWWADTKSYVEFTRPWYANVLPFPLSMYLPLAKRNAGLFRLQATRGGDSVSEQDLENLIMKDAKECLTQLSSKLGTTDYFFGDKPTSLDAIVFGYLALLLKAPLPNTVLQNHLKQCRNLCQLVQRILAKYFPLTPAEEEALRKQEEVNRQRLAEMSDFPNKRRNIVIAGVVAMAAMISYALLTGLVQIDFVDVEKETEGQPKTAVKNIADDSGAETSSD